VPLRPGGFRQGAPRNAVAAGTAMAELSLGAQRSEPGQLGGPRLGLSVAMCNRGESAARLRPGAGHAEPLLHEVEGVALPVPAAEGEPPGRHRPAGTEREAGLPALPHGGCG